MADFDTRKKAMLDAAEVAKDEHNDGIMTVDFSSAYLLSIAVKARTKRGALKAAEKWFDDPSVQSVVMTAEKAADGRASSSDS